MDLTKQIGKRFLLNNYCMSDYLSACNHQAEKTCKETAATTTTGIRTVQLKVGEKILKHNMEMLYCYSLLSLVLFLFLAPFLFSSHLNVTSIKMWGCWWCELKHTIWHPVLIDLAAFMLSSSINVQYDEITFEHMATLTLSGLCAGIKAKL